MWNESAAGLNGTDVPVQHIGLALLLGSFSVATVLGNSLVVYAVFRRAQLHSVTNYLIVSLAVIHLCGLPIYLSNFINQRMQGWSA